MNPKVLRANYLYDHGDLIGAEVELRAAMADGDDSAELHSMLGLCLLGEGLTERAMREARVALERQPDCAFAHYALSFIQLASQRPVHPPFFGAGRVSIMQAQSGLRSATEAVRLSPENGRYLVRLAEIRQMLGQWRKSLEPLEHALSGFPGNVTAAVLRAEALVHLRRSQEARAALKQALEMNPEASFAHAGMGWALLRAGDYQRAREFFNEALRLRAGLSWAQEGALVCAKLDYWIYRRIFYCKEWLNRRPVIIRILASVAAIAGALLALGGFLNFLDPIVRPRIGNRGTGILFLLLIFGTIIPVMFYEYIFLWLVRRQIAAKTTTGEKKKHLAKGQLAFFAIAIGGAVAAVIVGEISKSLLAVMIGLSPGAYLFWLVAKQMPAGVSRGWWFIYSVLILLTGPVIGIVFRDTFRQWHGGTMALLLCAPIIPVAVAIEWYKKKKLEQKHDRALNSAISKKETHL